MNINLSDLFNKDSSAFKTDIAQLARAITNKVPLELINDKILQANGTQAKSFDLAERLRMILQRSVELGVRDDPNLKCIDELCRSIIATPADPDKTFGKIPIDLQAYIRGFTSDEDIVRDGRVSKSWQNATPQAEIMHLNTGVALNPDMTASQIIDAIVNNPQAKLLEYADFTGIKNFDDDCLVKLTENCPNLKHLYIPSARISNDALKHLEKTPQLQSLNISGCEQLEADALKHLKEVPKLQSLNISDCQQLEADALKHLKEVPQLQSLNIMSCHQLKADALKYLKEVPKLQSLNTWGCDQLESDALKHLEKVPNLESLDISWCSQLEADVLKHLKRTPNLQSLIISSCQQLEKDALKHLKEFPNLQSLDIANCRQLPADALKHLKEVPNLQSLNIASCDQLEADVLKHLKETPNLQSLNIRGCLQFEASTITVLQSWGVATITE